MIEDGLKSSLLEFELIYYIHVAQGTGCGKFMYVICVLNH